VRNVSFNEDVRAAVHEAATIKGYSADVVDGCLTAIARDIGRDFNTMSLRPPDHPDRRTYQKLVEALGLVEAICEDQGDAVLVVRLRVEAFD
jgi:hypothetical protein